MKKFLTLFLALLTLLSMFTFVGCKEKEEEDPNKFNLEYEVKYIWEESLTQIDVTKAYYIFHKDGTVTYGADEFGKYKIEFVDKETFYVVKVNSRGQTESTTLFGGNKNILTKMGPNGSYNYINYNYYKNS